MYYTYYLFLIKKKKLTHFISFQGKELDRDRPLKRLG